MRWVQSPGRTQMAPVGSLKPNDFGFFDTLGNAIEIGQSSRGDLDRRNQAVFYGGSVVSVLSQIRWDYAIPRMRLDQRTGGDWFGFRIARTVRLTPRI